MRGFCAEMLVHPEIHVVRLAAHSLDLADGHPDLANLD